MRVLAASAPGLGLDQFPLASIEEYAAALQVAGRSPRTIGRYRDMLAVFRFFERDGHHATVADLQPVAVRRWLLPLNALSRLSRAR